MFYFIKFNTFYLQSYGTNRIWKYGGGRGGNSNVEQMNVFGHFTKIKNTYLNTYLILKC